MPIELSTPVRRISQDDYHAIDRRMLGIAFDIHNEFGRLLDECVYKAELTARCQAAGMRVLREARVRVTHRGFQRDYFIDLFLEDSVVVEAKAVSGVTASHHGQTLNYLYLTDTRHGSLVNFRTEKVRREFVSTTLGTGDRSQFQVEAAGWPAHRLHEQIREEIQSLSADVGLGLDTNLYREALAFLVTGAPHQLIDVPILGGETVIGTHAMTLLEPQVALAVTSFAEPEHFQRHLQRLLQHTRLRSVAWVNLVIGKITLRSIANSA